MATLCVLIGCSRKHADLEVASTQSAITSVRQLHTVAVGDAHWCAVGSDGTVACAGTDNGSGQLGDGTQTPHQALTVVPGLTGVKSVSAGMAHSCALTGDGKVSCWGNNDYSQLGKPTAGRSLVPYTVQSAGSPLTGQKAISAGYIHTCSLAPNGTVLCWGYNGYGELGNGGSPAQTSEPVPVTGLTDAVAIASGVVHTCALRSNGSVMCWGYNGWKQLGDGTVEQRNSPVSVNLAGVSSVVDLAAYYTHTCAFRANGETWCWGDNTYGQLGTATAAVSFNTVLAAPAPMSGVALGYDFGCGRMNDGRVRCWGWNDVGQLGRGTISAAPFPIADVAEIKDAVDLAAGFNMACALLSSGQMRCWGNNASAPADNTGTFAADPDPNIDVGGAHACALRSDGTVNCWGKNDHGQLGNPAAGSNSSTIVAAQLRKAIKVVTGTSHSCALRADGTVVCWGSNEYGQLGLPGPDRSVPAIVPGIAHVRALAAGARHTCAITTENAKPYCWGSNTFGQLGVSPSAGSSPPILADGAGTTGGWIDIAAGRAHTCVLSAAGTAACWGWNDAGQLGTGTSSWGYSSGVVTTLQGGSSLAAGADFTCAVVQDTVSCWGTDEDGQLGQGTPGPDRVAPVAVVGLTGVNAITAGAFHACALKRDGTVQCWGYNVSGQVGNSGPSSASPVTVAGLSGVVALGAGDSSTCALKTGGVAYCWGANSSGELGLGGDYQQYSTPKQVLLFTRSCRAEGVACTAGVSCCGGTCVGGVCQPPRFCGSNYGQGEPCFDNNPCTAGDTCDGAGHCVSGPGASPDDGNPCTTDRCDPVTGTTHTNLPPGSLCSNADLCVFGGTCNSLGQCIDTVTN